MLHLDPVQRGLTVWTFAKVVFGRFKYRHCTVSLRPAYPIRSEKNHEDDHFPFNKNHSSSVFFLALKVSYIVQWGSKYPHALSLLKRLTIALENHLLNENHLQNKDENVRGVVCYTVEWPK